MSQTIEHDAGERLANDNERQRINSIVFDDEVNASQSMIAQAEALLSACRLMVGQARDFLHQGDAFIRQGDASSAEGCMREAASLLIKIAGQRVNDAAPVTGTKRGRKRTYTRYHYRDVGVDLLQTFKSRLPGLGIGPLVVLITLLENHGRMVPAYKMRAAIDTDSRAIIKVYVSRLRNLFRSHGIDVEISVLHGGYGVPRDCTQRVMAGLGFNDGQIATALRLLHTTINEPQL